MSRIHLARAIMLVAILTATVAPTLAQPPPPGDFGDAPDRQMAYPDLLRPGNFPTCWTPPPNNHYVYHAPIPGGTLNNAFFGPSYDWEPDGNAGICPPPPYEQDEGYRPLDGDAGLSLPTPFTIGPQFNYIPFAALPSQSLGQTCGVARWGVDIEIELHNHHHERAGAPQFVFLNVLIDWDRSGDWQPYPVGPFCGGTQVSEHVVRNVPVPPGFDGLASFLPLPNFQIGPDSGYVWVRFSLTPTPVLFPYDGRGFFEGGESEDYLLHISQSSEAEYGDAPQGVRAYPPAAILGQFPTCLASGAAVKHPVANGAFFGTGIDFEPDGNAGLCGFPLYDQDECFGGEAGLLRPRPYTIDPSAGIVPCASPGAALGRACDALAWGPGIDLEITNNFPFDIYFNMLADWDQDGRWTSGRLGACPSAGVLSEHVVVNLPVPSGFHGFASQLLPPPAFIGRQGFAWTRFTVSTAPAPLDWDGSGNMGEGETEDYLLRIDAGTVDTEEPRLGSLRVGGAWPNPTRAGTAVELDLATPQAIAASVYDAAGRRVRDLGVRTLTRGVQRLEWDGSNTYGRRLATGAYFMRIDAGGETFTRRVLLLN